eukprot:m.1667259 g.1667259  ORF g.1667259 m.1667259 type:complete len:54 (-) comp147772_c0_seq1:17-178(-)
MNKFDSLFYSRQNTIAQILCIFRYCDTQCLMDAHVDSHVHTNDDTSMCHILTP